MPAEHHEDLALVAQVLDQRTGAYRGLMDRLDVALERCLARLLRQWPEASSHRADLRQGLELHLVRDDFKVLRTYRGQARLTTWVHAVGTRHFYREIRRLVRDSKRVERAEPLGGAPPPNPEQEVGQRARNARVRAVVDALSTDDKLLVGLLFDQELSAAGAGLVLGLEASGVRMRKKRLLARLAVKLKGLWP